MGVMQCSRGDCNNIMCRRFSHKYGYLCLNCFNELMQTPDSVTIKEFMKSDVGTFSASKYRKLMIEEEFTE